MMDLWGKAQEKRFFLDALDSGISSDDLFYETSDGRFIAYWEKSYKGTRRDAIQTRNGHIGKFTEKWVKELFSPIAEKHDAYAISNVVCDKIALPTASAADVAICKKNSIHQEPEDILMIIEVKMSLVWNWEYNRNSKAVEVIGDYNTHRGSPSILRSDSVLKAIGKSAKIRFSDETASQIPIIILGNSPIGKMYLSKVDFLKKSGIIQGFWSVNPTPLDDVAKNPTSHTSGGGFITFNDYNELEKKCDEILSGKEIFIHGMLDKKELGEMIESANNEVELEAKAVKLLELLRR